MNEEENKYAWTFRQSVGRGYDGPPRYARYTFDTLGKLLKAMKHFYWQAFKNAIKNGWKKRYEL